MCDIILCKKSYTRLTRNTRESKPRTLASLHCANTRDLAATVRRMRKQGERGGAELRLALSPILLHIREDNRLDA